MIKVEPIMRNAGLEEAQAGIKIAGRNINNLRYTDDTTLMAESDQNSGILQCQSVIILDVNMKTFVFY